MKPESVITALQNVAAQQLAESNQHITDKLCAFTAARDTHAANMQALKEIDTSIESCKQEQQTALNESAEAEQDWLVAGEKINYSSQDNDILTAIGFSPDAASRNDSHEKFTPAQNLNYTRRRAELAV